jgi:RNA polymerase-binding transcription factor DksA
MDGVREWLEVQRQQAIQSLASLTGNFDEVVTASRDTNADDEHDPEGATIAFERSQLAAHVAHVQGHLTEVKGAIERLDAGTYGICERCGQAIGKARIEARPAARECVRCASVATSSAISGL